MMTRADVVLLAQQSLEDVLVAPPKNASQYLLRTTSGTSGGLPIVAASTYALQTVAEYTGAAGAQRFMVCNGGRSARLAMALLVRNGNDMAKLLLLDAADVGEPLAALIADFNPNRLHGLPSFIVRVLPYVPPFVGTQVQSIRFLGERLSELQEQQCKAVCPQAQHFETYIASEAGGRIAARCAHLPKGFYHPLEGVFIEVSHPDESGMGELLISKSFYKSLRLERYQIGDVGRLREQRCPCGGVLVLELEGRKGTDYVKVAGAIVRKEECERVMKPYSRHLDDYRVLASETTDNPPKGKLVLQLYRRGGPVTAGLVEEMHHFISRSLFLTATQTLENLVAAEKFLPLTIEFVTTAFPESTKEVKLVRAKV